MGEGTDKSRHLEMSVDVYLVYKNLICDQVELGPLKLTHHTVHPQTFQSPVHLVQLSSTVTPMPAYLRDLISIQAKSLAVFVLLSAVYVCFYFLVT